MRVAGVAAANHEAAVGHALVIPTQLLLADEVDAGVVVGKVVRHADDGLLHGSGIGAFGQHHETFARVLFPRTQLGTRAAAHAVDGHRRRQCVLHAGLDARHPAHGIGMPLAQSLAPESVGHAIRQQRFAVEAIDGEHAGVPADGDQRRLAIGPRRLVHRREVFGNPRVGIETVDGIEHRRQLRTLHGQIILGAAAEDQHIDGFAMFVQCIHGIHRRAGDKRRQLARGTTGEDAHQRYVRVLADGGFDASSEVAVTGDANPNLLAHTQLLAGSMTVCGGMATPMKGANGTGCANLVHPTCATKVFAPARLSRPYHAAHAQRSLPAPQSRPRGPQRQPAQWPCPAVARRRVRPGLGRGRDFQSCPPGLRPHLFHPQGQERPGALRAVPAERPAGAPGAA